MWRVRMCLARACKTYYHTIIQTPFMLKVIYLKMEPYLRQWFIHENGGVEPVRLRRGTPESNIFQAFTTPNITIPFLSELLLPKNPVQR